MPRKVVIRECRVCGNPIIKIRLHGNKKIVCEAEPVIYWQTKKGKQQVVTPNGEIIICKLEDDIQRAAGIGYLPHQCVIPD